MKYFIEIWGCQMNEHDAETLAGLIEKKGFTKSDTIEEADLVVLYTCCIREKAEAKVLGRIGALKKIKDKKEGNMITAVGGCMTQQEDVATMIQKRFKQVDIIFGTHNLNDFDIFLEQKMANHEGVYAVSKEDSMMIKDQVPMRRADDLKAYVNIIYGCNNFCSYCIVPYVRGREKSRSIKAIREEVQSLLANGYKEITLLGQNVNSYGKDFKDGTDFSMLLKELDQLGDYRLRFMSSHPRDFNEALVDTISESKNVCPQFHLPVQGGSDSVLKSMNRGYTRDKYLSLVSYIKKVFPEGTISTDMIVGFPGETEEDFQDTLDLMEKVGFDQAYMFIYSVREGTRAENMPNHINPEVQKERFDRMLTLQKRKSLERNEAMLGKVYEVLVENKTAKGAMTGRTLGNKVINFSGSESLIGELVKVKVTDANTWSLFGEIVE
ncbi:tRNA-2-methylthio-N(6)-dimethylallyladenosine synthase MiaB [endosymbiont 'TC1' of Trimyema compressum]|uniref:tRNA (N6-isopentenyl adenosine(37)-C2)-methylthiotransferase MiaB n=1 Tax=endosymbiont 'TC1' of Trimyema compressum TaxID=243899 RepID=UPI0007F09B22|nr:tRNA (N6-isopentenyl adenosine(37)-C2)-methylthiotransferase MiaB [endosymbiont 'TC1' of Trimyema compressum]AMP20813.1 tRNA-2-methylthio-N(6)-dimethylallyladenosine synthase MiaB [endosymbiont 'TC1' of Trimyema compressum]